MKEFELLSAPTLRPISEGGEKWLGEVIPVLDHGFVYLVDYMGNDQSVEQAARVSYGMGTRKVSETRGLIRYLLRNRHTTPFEMVELKFHAKMPIFVARQWVRHRTASINEYSARYSILEKEFYVPSPEVIGAQSISNRQGRGEVLNVSQAEEVRRLINQEAERAYGSYELLLNDDGSGSPVDTSKDMLARELARMNLTLNFYTQWYWKVNLHNMLHFLSLRMDPHAQYEIKVYADAMARIVKDVAPLTWGAFEDYSINSMSLSGPEVEAMARLLQTRNLILTEDELGKTGLPKREQAELMGKLRRLHVLE